jgi:acetyltransferase-like isoleucine patch superfamily enzyme
MPRRLKGRENILGSKIGAGTLLAPDVTIGHPSKSNLLARRDYRGTAGAVVGEHCIIRSGTVIYENAVLSDNVQTAHHVVIREESRIGENCVLGNSTVIREGATLGRNVRVMDSVVISEGAQIGSDVFIGPNVSFTGGRYMTGALEAAGRLTHEEAATREGQYWQGVSVIVEDDVRIGSNAVILAGVRLGRGCVVAAGAVVSNDVPPGGLVAGNPARLLRAAPSSQPLR